MSVLEITTYGRNTLRRLRSESRLLDADQVPRLRAAYEVDRWAPTATLISEDLPDVTLADLTRISPLPAAAALHALTDVARILDAMHEQGLEHGDLQPASVLILPDGRAALARPERERQDDAHGFAGLAQQLLASPPPAAAAELGWALTADPDRRPRPLDLVAALDAVPPEEWSTNHLRREPASVSRRAVVAPRPAAPPLVETVEPEPEPVVQLAPPVVPAVEPPPVFVRIAPPKRRKRLFRRIFETFVILLGLVTVFGGGGAGAWLLFGPTASAGRETDAVPLEVRRMAVSVTPPQAWCPHASLHLAAQIVTDGGGGEVAVRWRLPDGRTTGPERFRVGEGRHTIRATFQLTLTGTEKLVGEVVAVVSPTGATASAPLRYLCQGASRLNAQPYRPSVRA